jgi:hypothetical protein
MFTTHFFTDYLGSINCLNINSLLQGADINDSLLQGAAINDI